MAFIHGVDFWYTNARWRCGISPHSGNGTTCAGVIVRRSDMFPNGLALCETHFFAMLEVIAESQRSGIRQSW